MGPFDCATAKRYSFEIANGLRYLHSRNILHNDLKGIFQNYFENLHFARYTGILKFQEKIFCWLNQVTCASPISAHREWFEMVKVCREWRDHHPMYRLRWLQKMVTCFFIYWQIVNLKPFQFQNNQHLWDKIEKIRERVLNDRTNRISKRKNPWKIYEKKFTFFLRWNSEIIVKCSYFVTGWLFWRIFSL